MLTKVVKPSVELQRQDIDIIQELRRSYDYVIIGGR